jgi:hypothetical protein
MNKISTINIKLNNIHHIDTSTAELIQNTEDDCMYSKSFVHTPQKFNRTSQNDSYPIPYPSMQKFRGSMVSQTTGGSSSNKKVYIDSDVEGIDIEEYNTERMNMQQRIPTCESIESNSNVYNENRRFFSSSFTDRNYYFMHNKIFDNTFSINTSKVKNKHTKSDIPKPGLNNLINLDNVYYHYLDYNWI